MLHLAFVFLLITFGYSYCDDTEVPFTLIAYEPNGIQITITDPDGVSEIFFWANVNKELGNTGLGEITLFESESRDDDVWIMEDDEVSLQKEDTIHYTVFIRKYGALKKWERRWYQVTEVKPRPPTTSTSTTSTTTTTTTTTTTAAPTETTTKPATTKPTTTFEPTTPSSGSSAECPEVLIEINDDSIELFKKANHKSKDFTLVQNINAEHLSTVNIRDCSIKAENAPEGIHPNTLDIHIY